MTHRDPHDELAAMTFQVDGVDVLKPCFNVLVYWQGGLQEHAAGILRFYEKSMELIRDHMRYCQTTWMKRPKKVSPDIFAFVPKAVAPDYPNPKEMQYLWLSAGTKPDAATDRAFVLYALPMIKGGMVRLVLPLSVARDDPSRLVALVQDLVQDLRFCWGSAGYSLHYDDLGRLSSSGESEIYPLLMRYAGIDIDYPGGTLRKMEHETGFGCINWLTLLKHDLIDKLGGESILRSRLPPEVRFLPFSHGLMLQAGERPELGCADDPESLRFYQMVGRALAPVRLTTPFTFIRIPPRNIASKEETEKWLARFETESIKNLPPP